MQLSDSNINALADLGLSTNQAKIYLCVLRTDGVHFQDIAKITKISREDVYRIVPKLEKMGLTERVLGHPTTVRALPVEIALANLIKVEKNSFADRMVSLEASTSEFVKRYKSIDAKATEPLRDEGNFVLLTEKNAIFNKGTDMICQATDRIDAMYSETQLAQFIPLFAEPLRKACGEGVDMRLIAEKKASEGVGKTILEKNLRNCKNLNLRYADRRTSHCVIVDHKQALSATSSNGYFNELSHLWTDNKGIVELLAVNFEIAWQKSEPAGIS